MRGRKPVEVSFARAARVSMVTAEEVEACMGMMARLSVVMPLDIVECGEVLVDDNWSLVRVGCGLAACR